jgi:hypothetical protein
MKVLSDRTQIPEELLQRNAIHIDPDQSPTLRPDRAIKLLDKRVVTEHLSYTLLGIWVDLIIYDCFLLNKVSSLSSSADKSTGPKARSQKTF